jgi:hypothetical protein
MLGVLFSLLVGSLIVGIVTWVEPSPNQVVREVVEGRRGAEKVTLPDGSEQWVYWRKDKP